ARRVPPAGGGARRIRRVLRIASSARRGTAAFIASRAVTEAPSAARAARPRAPRQRRIWIVQRSPRAQGPPRRRRRRAPGAAPPEAHLDGPALAARPIALVALVPVQEIELLKA